MVIKHELDSEIRDLKQKLRERERERGELWSGAFWLWIFFWPVLLYICIKKSKQGAKLDSEIRDMRKNIQNLERENWELEKEIKGKVS